MKIGLDARLYKETGVGRYIRNLIKYLQILDKENEYVVFLLKEDADKIPLENNKWSKKIADVKWHTWAEQVKMPSLINREDCDLVHFPYFNVPLLYGKPFIVSIHDLTILEMATGRATTHSKLYYEIKRRGFRLALQHALFQSKKIITVSNFVKTEIINNFKIPSEKIAVTYESGKMEMDSGHPVKAEFRNNQMGEYLLYVGNAHPHKNLETLIKAYGLVKKRHPEINLVLIGKDDFFYKRLQNESDSETKKGIHFIGNVTDHELASYYQNAKMFVFPSLSEGFGIPGLEAMGNGCPVASSDIHVFKEIYGEGAVYFDPQNSGNMADKISEVLNNEDLRLALIEKGYRQAEKYSWKNMAEETLKIYNESGLK